MATPCESNCSCESRASEGQVAPGCTGAKPPKAAMVCHGYDGLKILQSVKEKLLEKEKAKAASNINMCIMCFSFDGFFIFIFFVVTCSHFVHI